MRIAYWKSGFLGFQFTQEEVEKLGGIGTKFGANTRTFKTKQERLAKGPEFIISADPGSFTVNQRLGTIRKLTVVPQGYKQYVAQAQLQFKEQAEKVDLLEQAFLEHHSVHWMGNGDATALVRLKWAERKSPMERGKAKNGKPTNGYVAATTPKGNLNPDKIGKMLDRLNSIAAKHPGRIVFFVDDKDNKLKASIATSQTVG